MAASVTWVEGEGFTDDPLGLMEVIIGSRAQVCATATGPCFDAADAPGHVALLTAVEAFDDVESLEGSEEFVAELRALSRIPDGAIA